MERLDWIEWMMNDPAEQDDSREKKRGGELESWEALRMRMIEIVWLVSMRYFLPVFLL